MCQTVVPPHIFSSDPAGMQVRHTMDEKRLMQSISQLNHPFLVKLHSSFQDDTCLHMVLEYVPGGDFWTFLNLTVPQMFGCQ